MKRAVDVLLVAALIAAFVQCGVCADTLRLKNKTQVHGEVLQVDDEDVILRIPRDKIATVNGTALPAALVEGDAAPAFTATDLAGNAQSVGPGKAKVTLVHFWVHWCPHCRSDGPRRESARARRFRRGRYGG